MGLLLLVCWLVELGQSSFASMVDEVRKVAKALKEQNAYKTPGCSWIEVDNRFHHFYSVDTTHPRTEEIYRVFECLLGFS